MNIQKTKEKAEWLAQYFSKKWLAEKLGRTEPTIRSRFNGDSDWRIAEAMLIDDLYDRTKHLESQAQKLGL